MSSKILERPETFPPSNKTLGQFMFEKCETYSNENFLIDGPTGKYETFGQVKKQTVCLAINLQQQFGITSKDVIVTFAQNSINFLKPTLAGAYLGCIVSNFYSDYAMTTVEHLLTLLEPAVIFIDETTVNITEECLEKLNIKMHVVFIGASKKYQTIFDLMKPCDGEDRFRPTQVDFDETAIILFSSGTTGNPKGVCHTHQRLVSVIEKDPLSDFKDTLLFYTPFIGISNWFYVFKALYNGMQLVFYKNLGGEELLQAIEQYSITALLMSPVYSYKLTDCQNIAKYNITSLKFIILAGSLITIQQLENLGKCLGDVVLVVSYGSSEVSGIGSLVTSTTEKSKWNSLAELMHGVSLKVVDINTEELLGPNQKGEVRVKTPVMMKTYYKQNCNDVFDKDGFYKTGDIGYYDKNKFIYIVDRIKEAFKYNSFQIAPNLIESVLMTHPAVKDAAVVPVPAERKEIGDLPAACVVLKQNHLVTEEEIRKFVDEQVADFEKLRGGVHFVETIPRTPTGKIIRREVKKLLKITA